MADEDFARHCAAELKNSAANDVYRPPRKDPATYGMPARRIGAASGRITGVFAFFTGVA
jgi:hypothetical protein